MTSKKVADPPLGTRIGRFELVRLLGDGGSAQVFEAKHYQLGAPVAIKVITPQAKTDPELLERFFQEARTISAIRHEGIIDVFDLVIHEDGRPCIMMEFLDGSSFSGLLRQRGRIRPDVLVRWTIGFANALSAAHAAGVVHRDIKPGNLFVTRTGRTEVLDFGVAKLTHNYPTPHNLKSVAGLVWGTTPYMAPEQARGDECDGRTDIFALGVVMYQALVGKRPFRGNNPAALLLEHRKGAVPPGKLAPVPQLLADIVMRMLTVNRDDRYQTMAEVEADLASAARLFGVARARRESAPPSVGLNVDEPASGPVTRVQTEPPTMLEGSKPSGDSD